MFGAVMGTVGVMVLAGLLYMPTALRLITRDTRMTRGATVDWSPKQTIGIQPLSSGAAQKTHTEILREVAEANATTHDALSAIEDRFRKSMDDAFERFCIRTEVDEWEHLKLWIQPPTPTAIVRRLTRVKPSVHRVRARFAS